MNLELLAAIPDGTQDAQKSAVQAFVDSKKQIVRAAKVVSFFAILLPPSSSSSLLTSISEPCLL